MTSLFTSNPSHSDPSSHSDTASSSVLQQLFAPLHSFLAQASHQYLCHKLSDLDWIHTGVLRALDDQPSGCAFLQKLSLSLQPTSTLGKSHFFESCKSQRRLRHLQALNDDFTQSQSRKALPSVSKKAGIPELTSVGLASVADGLNHYLKDFHLYAGDGHFHAACSHDLPLGSKGKAAVGHLYALNLRTQFLSHLAFGNETGKEKPNDMEVLKRLTHKQLRQGAGKGEKVLYIWDRAGIDFRFWHALKQSSGIYFLSRTKTNMKLEHPLPVAYETNDPLNAGVLADEWVSHSQGGMIRRVCYVLPETGEKMSFMTNLGEHIPPGIVVHLYWMRWRIEKAFDEVKNKLGESKAWAKSGTAKKMQAQFIALAYNLGQLLHREIVGREALRNGNNEKKRELRQKELEEMVRKEHRQLPLLRMLVEEVTQLGVKFYRWLRHEIYHASPWPLALDHLKHIYAHF